MHKQLSEIRDQRSAARADVSLRFLKAERWKLNAKKGFTLIETFVAIVILTTALAGALSLASTGFNSVDVAGDQITAAYLAQDGIEYVRFERDTATLSGQGWLDRLGPCVSASTATTHNSCYFDSVELSPPAPTACTGGCPAMSFDSTDGFYNYGGAAPSKFTRTVSIVTQPTPSGSGTSAEAMVTVTVSWLGRNGLPQAPITLQEEIYNSQ